MLKMYMVENWFLKNIGTNEVIGGVSIIFALFKKKNKIIIKIVCKSFFQLRLVSNILVKVQW